MSRIDDGGQAFPIPGTEYTLLERGMSLRDWFAGQALSNICGTLTRDEVHDLFHGVKGGAIEARAAYALADAMLAARRDPPR